LHEGDGDRRRIELQGEGLDRITDLSAAGLELRLEPAGEDARSRTVIVHASAALNAGTVRDLSMSVRDYAAPIILPAAIRVAQPRPAIRKVEPSLPAELPIALRAGELPAGVQVGAMFHVTREGEQPGLRLSCRDSSATPRRVTAGSAGDGLKLSPMQSGMYFLSFDPGLWPGGCVLTAVLENQGGESEPFEVGRVVRTPQIDEFRLTDEQTGDGNWVGVLVGRDLELIGKTGWDHHSGMDVLGLPAPVASEGNRQALRVRVAWPSPTPRAPLYIWFRGEAEGRATTIRP
jgi:hypothetical protein